MRKHAGPAGQHEVTVMQSLAALTGQQFGYDMHNWGPGTPGNQQAIRQFQDWMETRGMPVPIRIRCHNKSWHGTQVTDAKGIIAALAHGSTACYTDKKPMFRILCGSV